MNPLWEVGVAGFGGREAPVEGEKVGEARAPVPQAFPRLPQGEHIVRWGMTERTEQRQGAPSSLIFAVERRPSLKIEKENERRK